MSQRKSFWQAAFDSLKEFFLWLLSYLISCAKAVFSWLGEFAGEIAGRLISWVRAIFSWLESFSGEIGKEVGLYLRLLVFIVLGAVLYKLEKFLPIEEPHHLMLSRAGLGISIGSAVMLGFRLMAVILASIGLLAPLIKLRDKILKKFDLL